MLGACLERHFFQRSRRDAVKRRTVLCVAAEPHSASVGSCRHTRLISIHARAQHVDGTKVHKLMLNLLQKK